MVKLLVDAKHNRLGSMIQAQGAVGKGGVQAGRNKGGNGASSTADKVPNLC